MCSQLYPYYLYKIIGSLVVLAELSIKELHIVEDKVKLILINIKSVILLVIDFQDLGNGFL